MLLEQEGLKLNEFKTCQKQRGRNLLLQILAVTSTSCRIHGAPGRMGNTDANVVLAAFLLLFSRTACWSHVTFECEQKRLNLTTIFSIFIASNIRQLLDV